MASDDFDGLTVFTLNNLPCDGPPEGDLEGGHRCEQCNRSYSRSDHLARHRQSHFNRRTFACPVCGKAFSRTDLLHRHSAIHKPDDSLPGGRPTHQQMFSRRVIKACPPCAAAKVKCHDEKPCRRCRKRGLHCGPTVAERATTESLRSHATVERRADLGTSSLPVVQGPSSSHHGAMAPIFTSRSFTSTSISLPCTDMGMTDDMSYFFDSIIQEEHQSQGYPSISDPGPPIRARTSQQGIDFCAQDDDWFTELFQNPIAESFPADDGDDLVMTKRIKQGHEAFQSSLLYSHREEGPQVSISLDLDADDSQSMQDRLTIVLNDIHSPVQELFDQRTRDRLLVTLAAFNQFSEHLQSVQMEFPSTRLMDLLAHRFLMKQDDKVDSWIHSATFKPDSTNVELAAMIVAAGAHTTPFQRLRQFGYRLHKLLQTVILKKLESGHKPRLQLLQAFLIGLELDLWHGEEYSLHQAGGLSNIIHTFLRLELRDKAWPYQTVLPHSHEDETELDTKWSLWVTAESYKRLSTRFCVYDNQRSMTLNIRPSTTFFEYRLPSPHPRSLWLAKSAAEWKELYLSRLPGRTPKVMELLASMPKLSFAEGFCDTPHSIKLAFHFLGGMIVDHHLFAAGFRSPSLRAGGNNELESVRSRRMELKTTIQSFEQVLDGVVPANLGSLIVSYLSMSLMVSIENIAILAGKEGEEESRRMYQIMKFWPQTPEAREAIWHAGQVLGSLTRVERLTSFHIVIAYQAGLALFGYSLLTSMWEDTITHPQQFPNITTTTDLPILYLNGTSVTQAEEFIHEGSYKPMLRSSCREADDTSLSEGCDINQAVSEIILDRAYNSEGLSPWLANGLMKLLNDLGAATRTSQYELQRQPDNSGFGIH